MMVWLIRLCLLIWAGAAGAADLSLPVGTRLVSERTSEFDSYALPVAPWSGQTVETLNVEGRVERQSWRVNSASITTLQLLAPLREQLAEAGFETLFECEARSCGGFDFRFAIEVVPAPDMYVDVRDYRFVAAQHGKQIVSLLVSRSRSAGYVQIIRVSPQAAPQSGSFGESESIVAEVEQPKPSSGFVTHLVELGHVALTDLRFETGTTDLSDADYGSLRELAEFMISNPSADIALVGHTDATGALDVNINVSRQRAQSVRERLIEQYEISDERLRAEGMGYLSPRASNLTPEGRQQNRRVEAILLKLE